MKSIKSFYFISIIFILSFFSNVYAAADIRFSSYRFTLDTHNRQQSFTLTNRGALTSRCTLGFSHNKVLEDGQLVRVESADEVKNSASPYLRFSPKRVSIPPNASQTVRLAMKRVKNQSEGEFVSYLRFSCGDDTRDAIGEVSVSPRINYNIPVVLRVGKLTAQGDISDLKLTNKNLSFNISHSGERSLYGNIDIIDSDSGDVIGSRKNVSIYVGVVKQTIEINLREQPKGEVTVKFKENPLNGDEIEFQATL